MQDRQRDEIGPQVVGEIEAIGQFFGRSWVLRSPSATVITYL
jgi:hypothetical protein